MAVRPLFIPNEDFVGVTEKLIDFQWFPGLSASQKKRSIEALHSVVQKLGYKRILEISSKSEIELGVNLSAFNLKIKTKKYGNVHTFMIGYILTPFTRTCLYQTRLKAISVLLTLSLIPKNQ